MSCLWWYLKLLFVLLKKLNVNIFSILKSELLLFWNILIHNLFKNVYVLCIYIIFKICFATLLVLKVGFNLLQNYLTINTIKIVSYFYLLEKCLFYPCILFLRILKLKRIFLNVWTLILFNNFACRVKSVFK